MSQMLVPQPFLQITSHVIRTIGILIPLKVYHLTKLIASKGKQDLHNEDLK